MQTTRQPRFVLASASPARYKLLRAAGIEPEVLVSGVDESLVRAERADEVSLTLARLKALAVAERIRAGATPTGGVPGGVAQSEPGGRRTLVLGCDSVLAFEGEILGKPADAEEATRRWVRMRGRSGVLYTGHCLIRLDATDSNGRRPSGGATGAEAMTGEVRRVEAVAATTVHFGALDDEEIAAYVATGEPLQVAGAFTIDGLGGPFVERVEGDPGTVIGLSLPLLRRLLGELGLRISDLWTVDRPAPTVVGRST